MIDCPAESQPRETGVSSSESERVATEGQWMMARLLARGEGGGRGGRERKRKEGAAVERREEGVEGAEGGCWKGGIWGRAGREGQNRYGPGNQVTVTEGIAFATANHQQQRQQQ
ncbi:hypothetical protein KM043_014103 [Ampulex compressa]|nr:hypothetical protein KM043_014103 [Ampulex compressa]